MSANQPLPAAADCYDAIEYVSALNSDACRLLSGNARKVADLWNDPPRSARQRDIVREVFEELADALDELLGGGPLH